MVRRSKPKGLGKRTLQGDPDRSEPMKHRPPLLLLTPIRGGACPHSSLAGAVAWPSFVSHEFVGLGKHEQLLPQTLAVVAFASSKALRELLAELVDAVVRFHGGYNLPSSCCPLCLSLLPRHTCQPLLGQLPPKPSHRGLMEEQVWHARGLLRSVIAAK